MSRGAHTSGRARAMTIASVMALHAGVFVVIGLNGPEEIAPVSPPPVVVELFRPPIPLPPPPLPAPPEATEPEPDPGGGAPAAPSVIRPTPQPTRPPEIVAPPTPALEQPLVIGAAPTASPTPGPGQGGQGEGTGTGIGNGDGPGSGGRPPIIVRGPSPRELLSIVPPEARAARVAGRARVNCRIRLDQRLEDCRVVDASPPGYRFEEAALRAADFFVYRPPVDAAGRAVEGQRVTIGVQFGRQ